MKKVLLLGDSIRQNYQEKVKEKLDGRAEVIYPAENCAFSLYTLCRLNGWLREFGNPDIVHWNNGIWDTCVRFPEDGPFIKVEDYVQTLTKILRVLRRTGAQVIFATSTPVVDPHHDLNSQTIAWYNHEALRFMKQEDVPIDDLYSLVYPNRDSFICEDHCHLSEAGKEACSDAVVKAIEAYL